MALKLIESKIRRAFSQSALHYDVLTSLHKEIARELAAKALLKFPPNGVKILDVGMGTGWLTNRLMYVFPDKKVYGLDSSRGMVDAARGKYEELKIIQADASRLPFKEKTFDLMISNLAYQWIEDLSSAFRSCYFQLNDRGALCLTMFGYDTCRELFMALEKTRKDNEGILPIRRLTKRDHVEKVLRAGGFENFKVDDERIKVRFPDMFALMQWLKDIGANMLDREIYVGKDWLTRANHYYNQNFSDHLGHFATFEVIWIQAEK